MRREQFVLLLVGNHAANPTSGIGRVAVVPWDHVYVQVHDRLTSCTTGVEADVVAMRRKLTVERRLDLVDEVEDRVLLCSRCVEPGCDQSLRDNECVSLRNRITIT